MWRGDATNGHKTGIWAYIPSPNVGDRELYLDPKDIAKETGIPLSDLKAAIQSRSIGMVIENGGRQEDFLLATVSETRKHFGT